MFQSLKTQQYRFSVIMNEIHGTDNVPYTMTLMSVINVLLLGQEDLKKRSRLRQEFIGTRINHLGSITEKNIWLLLINNR